MDADSSYGGSDTAQDTSVQDNHFPIETNPSYHDSNGIHQTSTVNITKPEENQFYHKNEITLPVNYDETDDSHHENSSKLPHHYLSTANLNINETQENHHNNLDEHGKQYSSTNRLNTQESPRVRKKSGVDNPAFHHDEESRLPETNGVVKSTFDDTKTYNNGDLNSSIALGLTSPTKSDEQQMTEAVNLELINLKPTSKDVTGPYDYGANGLDSIPVKKEADVEIGNPYDEYFVPVNQHRKYMRYVN